MNSHLLAPHPEAVEQYRQMFALYGRTPRALGWPDEDQHAQRLRALAHSIRGGSLLDFGCGLGFLLDHLGVWGVDVFYTGVDVIPEFIESCRDRFPGLPRFDVIQDATDLGNNPYSFTHIVACGVFNYKGTWSAKDHEAHVFATIQELWARCDGALHIDFLAPDVEYKEHHLYYQSIHTLLNWMKPLECRRWILDRSYLPNEFCVHFYKDAQGDAGPNIHGRKFARPVTP